MPITSAAFQLRPGKLTLADLRALYASDRPIRLDRRCWAGVKASAGTVQAVIREKRTVYGVNTGFGSLARTRIADDQVSELQRRLVLSHTAGTGPLLDDRLVRLIMILKINGLALGYSGVRRSVLEALVRLVNAGVHPCVPAQGSVGASGDLAPLAHMTAVLLGVGEVRRRGRTIPAVRGLKAAGLAPMDLAAKEGLALLNGTQVSTALAAAGLFSAEDVFGAALITGALAVDAAAGSDTPFDPRIHAVRGQPGQIEVAKLLQALLRGSEIRKSHIDCDRVQDPYSLRCQPQVMGAALDMLRFAAGVIERECNAVSDNPLVFARQGEILSGGNFHAEPVAMASDTIAILPGAGARPQFRLHDRPCDGGGAGLGEQEPGPSRERRQPADLGQPGRPCEHGHLCRAPPARDGRQHGGDRRNRAAGRGAGRRPTQTAEDQPETAAGDGAAASARAVLEERPRDGAGYRCGEGAGRRRRVAAHRRRRDRNSLTLEYLSAGLRFHKVVIAGLDPMIHHTMARWIPASSAGMTASG
jgi:histidine ammonia-lyase